MWCMERINRRKHDSQDFTKKPPSGETSIFIKLNINYILLIININLNWIAWLCLVGIITFRLNYYIILSLCFFRPQIISYGNLKKT